MLRWGILGGLLVAAVDLAVLLVTAGQPPDSPEQSLLVLLDLAANVALYSLAGFRAGRQAGTSRAGAEAGVLAGAIAGLAAVFATLQIMPVAAEEQPVEVVRTLAFNVVLGGLLGLVGGWLASRAGSERPPS